MNIRIKTDFNFSVSSIQYAPNGELQIILTSGEKQTGSRYQYTACLGSGQAEEKPGPQMSNPKPKTLTALCAITLKPMEILLSTGLLPTISKTISNHYSWFE